MAIAARVAAPSSGHPRRFVVDSATDFMSKAAEALRRGGSQEFADA